MGSPFRENVSLEIPGHVERAQTLVVMLDLGNDSVWTSGEFVEECDDRFRRPLPAGCFVFFRDEPDVARGTDPLLLCRNRQEQFFGQVLRKVSLDTLHLDEPDVNDSASADRLP